MSFIFCLPDCIKDMLLFMLQINTDDNVYSVSVDKMPISTFAYMAACLIYCTWNKRVAKLDS